MYEEGEWSVKGHFEAALENNEPIVWDEENGEHRLLVALVSTYSHHVIIPLKPLKLLRKMRICLWDLVCTNRKNHLVLLFQLKLLNMQGLTIRVLWHTF